MGTITAADLWSKMKADVAALLDAGQTLVDDPAAESIVQAKCVGDANISYESNTDDEWVANCKAAIAPGKGKIDNSLFKAAPQVKPAADPDTIEGVDSAIGDAIAAKNNAEAERLVGVAESLCSGKQTCDKDVLESIKSSLTTAGLTGSVDRIVVLLKGTGEPDGAGDPDPKVEDKPKCTEADNERLLMCNDPQRQTGIERDAEVRNMCEATRKICSPKATAIHRLQCSAPGFRLENPRLCDAALPISFGDAMKEKGGTFEIGFGGAIPVTSGVKFDSGIGGGSDSGYGSYGLFHSGGVSGTDSGYGGLIFGRLAGLGHIKLSDGIVLSLGGEVTFGGATVGGLITDTADTEDGSEVGKDASMGLFLGTVAFLTRARFRSIFGVSFAVGGGGAALWADDGDERVHEFRNDLNTVGNYLDHLSSYGVVKVRGAIDLFAPFGTNDERYFVFSTGVEWMKSYISGQIDDDSPKLSVNLPPLTVYISGSFGF